MPTPIGEVEFFAQFADREDNTHRYLNNTYSDAFNDKSVFFIDGNLARDPLPDAELRTRFKREIIEQLILPHAIETPGDDDEKRLYIQPVINMAILKVRNGSGCRRLTQANLRSALTKVMNANQNVVHIQIGAGHIRFDRSAPEMTYLNWQYIGAGVGVFGGPMSPPTGLLRQYNTLSNAGVVFNLDLSRRSDLGVRTDDNNRRLVLTEDEVNERRAWSECKRTFSDAIANVDLMNPRGKNTEDLLGLQVAAPVLHADPSQVSNRSAIGEARANRWYPPEISAWANFEELVTNFVIPEDKVHLEGRSRRLAGRYVSVSFLDNSPLTDEIGEQFYLGLTAIASLVEARLICSMVDGSNGLVANPDFWLANERQELVVVGEVKSTHNLPLPMTAADLVQQYNDALANRERDDPSKDQVRAWSHVGHPISQLIGYMVLNRCRFGLLTSATRTYFVHIQRQCRGDCVFVSNAWFIGQRSYLRAFAAFYHLASNDTSSKLSRGGLKDKWETETPPQIEEARDRKRTRVDDDSGRARARRRGLLGEDGPMKGPSSDGSRANADMGVVNPIESIPIERVQFDEIELTSPLGYGKQGTSFQAQWRGQTVAVKIFDATKPGGEEGFDNEIAAYTHLRDAWGKLVPFPKFISFAFGVRFLGMQMAYPPPADARSQDWADVLELLEKKYRFRHLDVWTGERGDDWQNLMVLKDDAGAVRPIVTDLEDYEIL